MTVKRVKHSSTLNVQSSTLDSVRSKIKVVRFRSYKLQNVQTLRFVYKNNFSLSLGKFSVVDRDKRTRDCKILTCVTDDTQQMT